MSPQSSASRVSAEQQSAYAHLLEQLHDRGLRSLETAVLSFPAEYNGYTAVVRATAVLASGSFSALGEASPNANHAPGALLELAEARAKTRAFEDALNLASPSSSHASAKTSVQIKPPASRRRQNRQEQGQNAQPAPTEPLFGRGEAITSAQRRFLFRLVVERGVDAKEAGSVISDLAGVRHTNDISKRTASALIDGIQSGSIEVVSEREAR